MFREGRCHALQWVLAYLSHCCLPGGSRYNLSESLFSDRLHMLQSQDYFWVRHPTGIPSDALHGPLRFASA